MAFYLIISIMDMHNQLVLSDVIVGINSPIIFLRFGILDFCFRIKLERGLLSLESKFEYADGKVTILLNKR